MLLHKLIAKLWAFILGVCIFCGICAGDGKFFYISDLKVPKTPYQRAVIFYDGSVETLIVQSKYFLEGEKPPEKLGWVMPVPNNPEIASMPAVFSDKLFFNLGFRSRPDVIRYSHTLLMALFSILLVSGLIFIIAGFSQKFRSLFSTKIKPKNLSITGLLFCVVSLFFYGFLLPALATAGIHGVSIIKSEICGVHDIKVIKAETGGGLISWLNENSFSFNTEDEVVFEKYIKDDWCFVVSLIESKNVETELQDIGLVDPLILRFRSEKPVYPLSLTSTAGSDTEILLYLASDKKYYCGKRLKLKYCGYNIGLENWFFEKITPADFFEFADYEETEVIQFKCLMKYGGTLTYEQMNEDLYFTEAKDDKKYRETVYMW